MPAPQRIHFSKRKNGKMMASIPMDLHLEQGLIDFVAGQLGLTRAQAVDKIVREASFRLSEDLGWREFSIAPGIRGALELGTVHVDRVQEARESSEESGEYFASFPADGVSLSYQG